MEEVERKSSTNSRLGSTNSNRVSSVVSRANRPIITTRVLVSDSFVAKGKVKCVFCARRYYSDQCGSHHNVNERLSIARDRDICTQCFKRGNYKCTRRAVCKYCLFTGHAEAFCKDVQKTVMKITQQELEPTSSTPSPDQKELRSSHEDEDGSGSEKEESDEQRDDDGNDDAAI